MFLVGDASATPPPQPPKPKPPPPPPQHAGHPAAPPPMPADKVEKKPESSGGLFGGLEHFAKDEWTSVAGLAHGVMTAPGIAANAFRDAAESNEKLAQRVEKTMSDWSKELPSVRQTAIRGLESAGDKLKSSAVSDLARDLDSANTLPRVIEAVGKPVDRALGSIAKNISSRVESAIGEAPSALQAPMRSIASRVERTVGDAYASVRSSVKDTMQSLPSELEARAGTLQHTLEDFAKTDSAKAGGLVKTASHYLGFSPGDAAKLTHLDGVTSALDHVGALRDTPVIGLAFAAAGTALDAKKVGLPDSVVANFGSTIAGTAIGSAATTGITSMVGGAAIADGAAELAGVAAATGPVGWAVAGGVVIGAVAGYGIYKAVESQAGQNIINGVAHLNGGQIVKGLGEAGTDVEHMGEGALHAGESAVHSIGSFLGI